MSQTDTLDQITATRELALAQLKDLERQRRDLAIDVVIGSVEAAGNMEAVDMQVGAIKSRLRLCDLAEEQHAKREQAAVKEAAEREQARLEAEAARLTGERGAAIRGVYSTGIAAGKAVAEAVRIDDELALINDRFGISSRSIRGICGELVGIAVRDESGVRVEAVLNFRRAQLLAEYVLADEAGEDEQPVADDDPHPAADPGIASGRKPGPTCSVCQHEARVQIEAELEAGGTVVDVAARHGVSKSALSRHRQHG